MKNNFFNLTLKHKEVIDFYNDHLKSVQLYKESFTYLETIDVEHQPKNEEILKISVDFFRSINQFYSQMQEVFVNLFISYYAFKKVAQTNAEIQKEFLKLPSDFQVVQKTFTDLMDAYALVLADYKKLI